MQQLRKLIRLCHKDDLDKPITTFKPIEITQPMKKPTVKPMATKQVQGNSVKNTNKNVKKS